MQGAIRTRSEADDTPAGAQTNGADLFLGITMHAEDHPDRRPDVPLSMTSTAPFSSVGSKMTSRTVHAVVDTVTLGTAPAPSTIVVWYTS